MTALLEVVDLSRAFTTKDGGRIRAVDRVSFRLAPGETLGIVGESGCGKSTLARLILQLIPATGGSVLFEGEDLARLSPAALRRRRRDMQIVFQDPFASLDPRLTVGGIVAEPLTIHGIGSRASRRAVVADLLARVGLPPDASTRYPHEFSGGQRQRIGIARAIALRPRLVIADEPVSALDVSIRAQILNLLMDLKADLGLSYIFISHDLSVVEHVSDRVAVMYLGRIVESATAEALYARPSHPYTRALISAIPEPDPSSRDRRIALPGEQPSPEHPPAGCPFHPRCPHVRERCADEPPPLRPLGEGRDGHLTACHYAEAIAAAPIGAA
ncbi:MAG: ABC transporter ATP-binding protein [Alphaproteobacteria bacterium]